MTRGNLGELHYGCLGGDNTNAIGPKDKRNDSMAIAKRFKRWEGDDLFRQQVKAMAKIMEPIAPWLIFCGLTFPRLYQSPADMR